MSLALVIDLAGTFAFALSGAMLAARRDLDLFGLAVLAVTSAMAGGMIRDALLGATPVAALSDIRYLVTALIATAVVALGFRQIERLEKPVMLVDAIGLGFFAVGGCTKALDAGLSPLPAMLMGVLTGVGGGAVRDVLVQEVPRVLREDIYALAAMLGSGIVVLGGWMDLSQGFTWVVAIVATAGLRIQSVRHNWHLPRNFRR